MHYRSVLLIAVLSMSGCGGGGGGSSTAPPPEPVTTSTFSVQLTDIGATNMASAEPVGAEQLPLSSRTLTLE